MLLQEGDVIELTEGMKVYAELPQHCVYGNRRGIFNELATTDITIGEIKGGLNTDFLAGRYIVVATAEQGGGRDLLRNETWPNGHHVTCQHHTLPIKVSFYQTGAFTAMITNIKAIGRATMTWKE